MTSPVRRLAAVVLALSVSALRPAVLAAQDAAPALRLPRLFADGMVLQREVPVPVWGWSAPGARVTVTFDGRPHAARAAADGRWQVTLPAMPAGGPHAMTVAVGDVAGAGGARRELRDILVGDVWVASGQSNIEWTVADANDAAREIAAAHDPQVRHFKVPTSWAWQPQDTLAGGAWAPADPAHVGAFTAVGWFFARELRRAVDVPVGLLHTSWGGSRIEPWMSARALGLDAAALARLEATERAYQARQGAELRARFGGALPTTDAGMVDGWPVWADPALDDAAWATLAVPAPWESAGYPGMDGVAWYRTSFELTAAEAAGGVRIGLGQIDDSDESWVNGVRVGGMTNAWSAPREYAVPAAALRAGRNVVAVRVTDVGGGGGIAGAPSTLWVEVGGRRRPLAGDWKFRIGVVSLAPDGQHINKIPTVVGNAMVHPLLPFPVKGVLWYQGESNADSLADAVAYRGLFAGLIGDWRQAWGAPRLPFLWVQLANFHAADTLPPTRTSAWAALRASQSAALALPATAQVVTIDVGQGDDIHPRNKQVVGARLALAARAVAYGQRVEHSGPVYRAHAVAGDRVTLRFAHLGGGLVAGHAPHRAGGALQGFAVSGADRRFHWAEARIVGDVVVVRSDRVPRPVAVRYAWSDNPETANLYNAVGLPASPFRTDAW